MDGLPRKFKVVFMGPTLVGKTSIVIRFSKGTFSSAQESTIGAAYLSRDVQTQSGLVTLSIWDTAGQERFKSLVPKYLRGAHAIIIVFDVSNPDSYASVQEIFNDSAMLFEQGSRAELFLVANKTDLPPQVDLWNARRYAESVHATYFETSAKLGANVNDLFLAVAERVAKLPANSPPPGPEPGPPTGSCC
jgi:Ras-related protein Rab-5C